MYLPRVSYLNWIRETSLRIKNCCPKLRSVASINQALKPHTNLHSLLQISVHYRGTLLVDGSEFDASYNRGQPLSFTVGEGQVIKGWDEGLLDMCIGDKRKLTIPPEFAYGERAMGPIPAGSTLGESMVCMPWVGVKAD